MSFQIVRGLPEHASELAALGAKTFYDTFRPYQSEEDLKLYIDKAYNEDLVRRNLLSDDVTYFMAYSETMEPAGYVKLLHNVLHPKLSGASMELEKIYVLTEYLGSGLGKQLMQIAIDFSRQQGFVNLFLGVWQENSRAINFYHRFGFAEIDVRTFQLGQKMCDDYILNFRLD